MFGNPFLDAVGSGVVGTIAGWITKKSLPAIEEKPSTVREFYRTGGDTVEAAIASAKELERLGGWQMSGYPKFEEIIGGRDVCPECEKEFVRSDDECCVFCGTELIKWRWNFESFSVDLYRDVPSCS